MVSGGELTVDSGTLAPELRHWHGLLVVGTAHGTLHLLDLALDLGGKCYGSHLNINCFYCSILVVHILFGCMGCKEYTYQLFEQC